MQGQAMENVVGWLRQDQLLLVQLQGGGDQIWRRQSYVSSEVRKPAGRMREAVRSSERDFRPFTNLVPVNVRFAVISMKTHWNYFVANPEGKWTQRMPLILSSCNTFRKKMCNFENAFSGRGSVTTDQALWIYWHCQDWSNQFWQTDGFGDK